MELGKKTRTLPMVRSKLEVKPAVQDRRLQFFRYCTRGFFDKVCAYCGTFVQAGTPHFNNGPLWLCVSCFTKRAAYQAYEVPHGLNVKGSDVLTWAEAFGLEYATNVRVLPAGKEETR